MVERVAIGVGVVAHLVGFFIVSVGGGYVMVPLGLLSASAFAPGGWLGWLVALETLFVGLVSGFFAGLVAGDLPGGAVSGLVAGALGGLLLVAFIAVVLSVLAVLLPGGGPEELVFPGGVGARVAAGVVVVALAVDSAVGGTVGGTVGGAVGGVDAE